MSRVTCLKRLDTDLPRPSRRAMKIEMDHNDAMRVALDAQVCVASVKKRIRGGSVRGESGKRLEATLVKLGFVKEEK